MTDAVKSVKDEWYLMAQAIGEATIETTFSKVESMEQKKFNSWMFGTEIAMSMENTASFKAEVASGSTKYSIAAKLNSQLAGNTSMLNTSKREVTMSVKAVVKEGQKRMAFVKRLNLAEAGLVLWGTTVVIVEDEKDLDAIVEYTITGKLPKPIHHEDSITLHIGSYNTSSKDSWLSNPVSRKGCAGARCKQVAGTHELLRVNGSGPLKHGDDVFIMTQAEHDLVNDSRGLVGGVLFSEPSGACYYMPLWNSDNAKQVWTIGIPGDRSGPEGNSVMPGRFVQFTSKKWPDSKLGVSMFNDEGGWVECDNDLPHTNWLLSMVGK